MTLDERNQRASLVATQSLLSCVQHHDAAAVGAAIDAHIARLNHLRQGVARGEFPAIERAALLPHDPTECGSDFVLDGASAWITVDSLSVYIKREAEGVVVDVFPAGAEGTGSLASTYAYFDEAEEVVCEELGISLDDVLTWSGARYEEQSPDVRAQLLRAFAAGKTFDDVAAELATA